MSRHSPSSRSPSSHRPAPRSSREPAVRPSAGSAARPVGRPAPAGSIAAASSGLLPLGALAAGFGLFHVGAVAQTAEPPAASASAPALAPAPASALTPAPRTSATKVPPKGAPEGASTLAAIAVKAQVETDANSVRATTSTIGKGNQDLRDIPQSVTVLTEKLLEDRRVDTLKQALHLTAGVTFQAAEGGEEDIRLRGFSLAASGDIYVDSLRDPAFYERDTFSYDRVELLRGSASMLFGRGSTGGVVNQVSKLPFLGNAAEINATVGNNSFLRFTGDFNLQTTDASALRINVMETDSEGGGGNDKLDKQGLAVTQRWGINTPDEFYLSGYYLTNNNGINYGIPWLRQTSTAPASATNPSGLVHVDPRNYYGAASDYNVSGASLATAGWTHRFGDGGELKSAVRQGHYNRDLRAGTIRFTNPTGADNINDATQLTRGLNNKVQSMNTTYAQSDYSKQFKWFGINNDVLTGVDLAHEVFDNYAVVLPPGVVLDKNTPRTTIGTPNDGTGYVDETLRQKRRAADFDAKALGVYFQDLVEVVPHWKVLAGVRWDDFKGDYRTYQTANPPANPPAGSTTIPVGTQLTDRSRSDQLWSKRAGLLYQPTETASFHFSYGTSFNTSGDTYQYDDQTKNTPPESSENYELGSKVDWFDGKLSTRTALFYSIKKNERNRDPDSAAFQAVLSGRRHAAGLELEAAGRITPVWDVFASYAWTPIAKIDVGAPGSVYGVGEGAGTRSALTPRHSGTVWTTYQITQTFRLGGGVNYRSSETPNRNPAGIVAPSFVTGDLLAEYLYSQQIAFKINVNNVTNKLYADSLYTGHYIPGLARAIQGTMTARF